MRLRISPLVLAGLALLAAINGCLLLGAIKEVMSADLSGPDKVEWKPRLPDLDAGEAPITTAALHPQILAHPIFSKSRLPFVPPPAPPAKPAPPPPVVFIDPGFVIGGVMIKGEIKKAYLLRKSDRNGTWVGEGEDFVGWKVQSISTGAATLEKDSRTIEVRLYAER
jgi:hypothetical protein